MSKLRFTYIRDKHEKSTVTGPAGDVNDDIRLFFNFMLVVSYTPDTVIRGMEAFLEEYKSNEEACRRSDE